MTDSKITPVTSSNVSGTGAIGTGGASGGPVRTAPLTPGQTAQILLKDAAIRQSPPDLRAGPQQDLRIEGRIVATNPASGEIRIATPRGDITVAGAAANLPTDTPVTLDIRADNGTQLATIMQRAATREVADNTPSAPIASAPVRPAPAAPLQSGDSVPAIHIPADAQEAPPAPPAPQEITRAATIIESLTPADVAKLPQPLPVPPATALQLSTAPDVEAALQQLPVAQQQAIVSYLAQPDVAAKLETMLSPAILAPAGENIDQNMADIVNAQVSTKLAPENVQLPQAVPPAPTSAGAYNQPIALRSLMPLMQMLQDSQEISSGLPAFPLPPAGAPFADQMPENMVQISVLAIAPPAAAASGAIPAAGIPAAETAPPLGAPPLAALAPGSTGVPLPAPPAGELQGVVESITQTGLPVVRAGGDLFILKTDSPVAPGSLVTFTMRPLTQGETLAALTIKGAAANWTGATVTADKGFQPLRGEDWPALQQTLQNLAGTNVEAALRDTIPSASARLVPTTLFFLAALRAGDIESWLGGNALQALKSSGRQSLAERLTGDFGKIAEGARETLPGDWRGFSIPLLLQDEQISQMQLFLRRHMADDDRSKGESEADRAITTRFLLNLHLSRMGDMQLDGLMKKQRLDLILRSRDALSAAMRQQLTEGFAKGLAQSGMDGAISFQAKHQGWVTVDLPQQQTLI